MVEARLRRLFSGWHLDERAFVVAPLALWLLAFLFRAAYLMAIRRRVMSRGHVVRELGPAWKVTFVLAVAWLIGCAIWLTFTDEA